MYRKQYGTDGPNGLIFGHYEWDSSQNRYVEAEIGVSGESYSADLYDELVNSAIQTDCDLRQLVIDRDADNTNNFFYDSDQNRYVWLNGSGGGGLGISYALLGYQKNPDNTYSAYYGHKNYITPYGSGLSSPVDPVQTALDFLTEREKQNSNIYKIQLGLFFTRPQEEVSYGLTYTFSTPEAFREAVPSINAQNNSSVSSVIIYYVDPVPSSPNDKNVKLQFSYNGTLSKLLSYEYLDTVPSMDELITPTESSIRTELDADVRLDSIISSAFPDTTLITAQKVVDEATIAKINQALLPLGGSQPAAYEITATLHTETANGTVSVQPLGKISITLTIPDYLSTDNLKLFFITPDNQAEEIPITVDADSRSATAELTHFSTYVLCNVNTTPEPPSPDNPATGDFNLSLFLSMLTLLFLSFLTAVQLLRHRSKTSF